MCATKIRRILPWAMSVALSIAIVPDGMAQPSGDQAKKGAETGECIRFGNPDYTDSISKYEIRKPGHYCLTEDLHARLEFADHMAESKIILILSSDVVLDLQGHTLGRGRLFKNPGGLGVYIESGTNVHIKNGTLQDFKTAILRGPEGSPPYVPEAPVYDASSKTYRFPISGIVIENVTFKNNKDDMRMLLSEGKAP